MNVFWHELRIQRKSMIIWSICISLLMIVSMAKYEAITAQGGAAIQVMLKTFPSTVQALFGMNGLDLTTVGGYFGVCFLLMAIVMAVHAGLLGASLLAEEENGHTVEFLYVRPIGRPLIVTEKLLAGIINLGVVWAAATVGSIGGIVRFAQFDGFVSDFWRMMVATALIQLMFFSVGLLAAAVSKGSTIYGRTVSIAVFGSYLLYTLAKLSSNFSWAHYVSIFSWYDALDILQTHSLKFHYIVLSIAVSGIAIAAAYVFYNYRDLRT